MLSVRLVVFIGVFLFACSWHSPLCLRKDKRKSAQYKAKIYTET